MRYFFLFLALTVFPTRGYTDFDEGKFKSAVSEAIDLIESSIGTYQDKQYWFTEIWNDRNNRGGVFDGFFDEKGPRLEVEKLDYLLKNQAAVTNNLKSYQTILAQLHGLEKALELGYEQTIFQTSKLFERLLQFRGRFLKTRRATLSKGVALLSTRPGTVYLSKIDENLAQVTHTDFVDRDYTLVLLYPFIAKAYLTADSLAHMVSDPYLQILFSSELQNPLLQQTYRWRTPDEALDVFPIVDFLFAKRIEPSMKLYLKEFEPLNDPNEKGRKGFMRKQVSAFENNVKKKLPELNQNYYERQVFNTIDLVKEECSDLIGSFKQEPTPKLLWNKAIHDPLCKKKLETTLSEIGLTKLLDLAMEFEKLPLSQKSSSTVPERNSKRSKNVLNSNSIAEIKLTSTEVTIKPEVGETVLPSIEEKATALVQPEEKSVVSSQSLSLVATPLERERKAKRNQLGEGEVYQRPINTERQKERREKQEEYRLMQSEKEITDYGEACTEKESVGDSYSSKRLYSADTENFIRNIFQIGKYGKTGRNVSHLWNDFVAAYAEIKLIRQGISGAIPDGSAGGSARRIYSEKGQRRVIHDPSVHGWQGGAQLAGRLMRIFQDFGWTPENLGIQED